MSEACGDWFKDILCAFLASEDPETKKRLVWELLCMVPKKNSKTTYVAALGLTALFMEEAPNRQMLLVAPSQNISERCFDQAQGMIRLDPRLKSIFKVQDHLKCITRRKTGTAARRQDVRHHDRHRRNPDPDDHRRAARARQEGQGRIGDAADPRRRHHHAGRPGADDHHAVRRAAGGHLEDRTEEGARHPRRQGRSEPDPAAGAVRVSASATCSATKRYWRDVEQLAR
jgi:hypothetical protein